MQLPEIDFRSLEIREIGDWPLILRVGVIIAACIATFVLAYFLLLSGAFSDLDLEKQKLEAKQKEFKEQYTMAVNLDAYKAQITEMETTYQDYIKQLPSASNIPDLIDVLTKTGERNGLKIEAIKLGDPKLNEGFYMAMPLSISMTGGYHSFALFISDVAKMARIVTLHDFTIKPATAGNTGPAGDNLHMDIEAETYWLASQLEIDSHKPSEAEKKAKAAGGSEPGGADMAPGSPGAPTAPGAPAGPGGPGPGHPGAP